MLIHAHPRPSTPIHTHPHPSTLTPPPVLASANPVGSRYNPSLSVVDNIQLPPSLMSRFDLIYLLLDKPNEATDRRLAKHLVALFGDAAALEGNKARTRGIGGLFDRMGLAEQGPVWQVAGHAVP